MDMVMGRKQRMTGDDIVLLLGLEAYNLPDVHSLVAVFTCTFFILSQCIYAVVRRLVILVVLYNPSACGVNPNAGNVVAKRGMYASPFELYEILSYISR